MESKKVQKLSKAVVATVLASSGIAVVLPQPASAYMFSDLNPSADYYQPIVDLFNRGVVSGYSDGTFKPNNAITRGDAAKMLALALKLNIKNPTNPLFTDVPRSNEYYPYIAALSEADIINGYSDKTFRPQEPITRGQMAKIITLGYKFGVSSKLNHNFKDVSSKNANSNYIQTLVDLGITKGRTPITFEPFSSVTRAQLATFIWRAGDADAGDPLYEVGNITDGQVYINGVAYNIPSNLTTIFNPSNARVLKGAQIEGTFDGKNLVTLSKLTINASGTSAQGLLSFDGGDTSFNGELVINGSHLRFKNWTLNGQVYVAEAPSKSLGDFAQRIPNLRIASLDGFGFIDWSTPSEKEEENYLNAPENETLKPKPPTTTNGWTTYSERMPKAAKYVTFIDCFIRNLFIEQDQSFVSSDTAIDRVTVQGYVRQFELYADANAMYIDTETNLTMYGVGDYKYVYKNTYQNVFFNMDSYMDFLYVGTASGWIDLGGHVHIDEAVIPPKKTPNEIFDDYENDNGNIGIIEDPDGTPVDRDPIENQIVPDKTKPGIERLTVAAEGSSAKVTFTSDEDGTYYYIVREASAKEPTIKSILGGDSQFAGDGRVKEGESVSFDVKNLEQLTEYVVYLVVIDAAENVSERYDASFQTKDGVAPKIDSLKAEPLGGGQRAEVTFKVSESGAYRYIFRSPNEPVPTAEEVWRLGKSRTLTLDEVKNGVKFVETGLTANSPYIVYALMEDTSGNRSTVVQSKVFSTLDLDLDPPTVVKLSVTDILKDPTKVTIEFNEKLDRATAEDVKNYELGGTGNLTGNPFKAILNSSGKGVTLEIPSMAAFVFNDTLTVTISKVQDEAGNEITETTETYRYNEVEPGVPKISGLKVENDGPSNSFKISKKASFEATAAGAYYYLIIPIDPTGRIPKPERADIIFPDEYLTKHESLINFSMKGNGNVQPGENVIRGLNVDPNNLDFKSHPYGYQIYVAMQDRNGQFAPTVEDELFIGDESAPQISRFDFMGATNSPTGLAPSTPVSDEEFWYPAATYTDQKYFKFEIAFDEMMDENSIKNLENYKISGTAASKVSLTDAGLSNDKLKATLTFTAKDMANEPAFMTPYNLNHGEELKIDFKEGAIYDNSKTNTLAPASQEFKYRDVIAPKLKFTDAIRQNDNYNKDTNGNVIMDTVDPTKPSQKLAELELTFTEKINTISPQDFIVTGDSGRTIPVTGAQRKTGDYSKVIITLGDKLGDTESINIEMKDIVKDIENNKISILNDTHYNALYIYREIPYEILAAEIFYERPPIGGVYVSKTMEGVLNGQYEATGIELYYLVTTSDRSVTPEQVMLGMATGFAVTAGSKNPTPIAGRFKLTTDFSDFVQGHYVHFIFKDQFNNVSRVYTRKIAPPSLIP